MSNAYLAGEAVGHFIRISSHLIFCVVAIIFVWKTVAKVRKTI